MVSFFRQQGPGGKETTLAGPNTCLGFLEEARSTSLREFRDPIHGFITLESREENSIVDSKVFQRLRRIRQLAMASLVYPGALHTRFEHTLGVAHLAGKPVTVKDEADQRKRLQTYNGAISEMVGNLLNPPSLP